MAGHEPDGRRPDQDEDGLYDEWLLPVGHTRLWIGITLVLAAIVMIVLENQLGIVATPAPAATTGRTSSLASMATPVVIGGVTVEPRYAGRASAIGHLEAGPGKHFIVVGVRLVNGRSTAIRVDSSDFRVLNGTAGTATAARARTYAGESKPLAQQSVPAGASTAGYVVVDVPDSIVRPVLQFRPEFTPGTPASWSLP